MHTRAHTARSGHASNFPFTRSHSQGAASHSAGELDIGAKVSSIDPVGHADVLTYRNFVNQKVAAHASTNRTASVRPP